MKKIALPIAIVFILAGCGNKGPLTLPPKPAPVVQPAPAPEGAATPATDGSPATQVRARGDGAN